MRATTGMSPQLVPQGLTQEQFDEAADFLRPHAERVDGELGLSGVRRSLEERLGMEVDLSAIRREGPFDNPRLLECHDR